MAPLVSAVVATRDRPELLRETLAAIASQDYEGVVETVVVFDQTEPDLDLQVVGGDRPVIVVANERSPGLQGARNTGIARSMGELVAFCDDDDVWAPAKIRRQVEVLDANNDVHLVGRVGLGERERILGRAGQPGLIVVGVKNHRHAGRVDRLDHAVRRGGVERIHVEVDQLVSQLAAPRPP